MATLQRIRNHQVALLVIVGLAMAAFIIGDLLTSSSSIMQSSRDKVVVINGKKVTYEEFEIARQRKQDFIKAMQGQELDNNATQQLTQQVYNEMITKNLLNEQVKKLGFAVTKGETNELIQGQNISPVLQQMFGQQTSQIVSYFVNLITNDAFDQVQQQNPFFSYNNWMEIEDQVNMNRLASKYLALVNAAVKPNKLEAKDSFEGDNTECTFAYVRQAANTVADSLVTITKDDVKKYFDSSKRTFKLNSNRRNISYINVALRPSDLDFAEAEEDIKAVRDEFATTEDIEELVNGGSAVPYINAYVPVSELDPEIRAFAEQNPVGAIEEPHRDGNTYTMARIMDKTVAPDSTEVAIVFVNTKEEADSIYQVLAQATDATEALASYSNQQKYVGWMVDTQAVQSFGNDLRNEIRNAANGQTFQKEVNGTNVVCKVTGKSAPVALAKVAVYTNEVIPSSRTRREEYGKLKSFLNANTTVKAMQDSARSAGYNMTSTTIYETAYNIGGVQDARQAVRFAFTGEKNAISEIFETTGDNLLVVAITGDLEEGYMNLNDSIVYQQISRFNVAPIKKVEYLAGKFNEVADKTLNGYASAFNTKVDTAQFVNFNLNSVVGLGAEPKVFEAALKANEGEVVTVTGKNSVVALQVLNKNNKGLEYDEDARLQTIAHSRDYSQLSQAPLVVLQNNAEIEDNRINFY